MNLPKTIAIASTTFAMGLIFTATALAVNLPSQAIDNRSQNLSNQANDLGLQGGRLQACQARENAIKQRSIHLVQLTTTMESKFDAIASRVENYYNSKVVPSGKTVTNYNALVSDIQAKKNAVSTALTATQNDATNFSCTSANPKSQLTQYRKDMQGVIKALKDYRTSIRNLIVAVHSVVGEENKASASPGGNPR